MTRWGGKNKTRRKKLPERYRMKHMTGKRKQTVPDSPKPPRLKDLSGPKKGKKKNHQGKKLSAQTGGGHDGRVPSASGKLSRKKKTTCQTKTTPTKGKTREKQENKGKNGLSEELPDNRNRLTGVPGIKKK